MMNIAIGARGAVNQVTKMLKRYDEILAVYLYGSVLSQNYKSGESDIDFLIIAKNLKKPFRFIEEVRENICSLEYKLDVNIVFESEFVRRWHVYRPPSYFIGIKKTGKLLFGKDVLNEVNDDDVTSESVYKRIVDLAQSSRSIFVNGKDVSFWEKKYVKWLRVIVLEILFLEGDFDLNFDSGYQKLIKRHSELGNIAKLEEKDIGIKKISEIAEELRVFMERKIINAR